MVIVKDMASNKYLVMDRKNTYCYNIIETMINIFLKCDSTKKRWIKTEHPIYSPDFISSNNIKNEGTIKMSQIIK